MFVHQSLVNYYEVETKPYSQKKSLSLLHLRDFQSKQFNHDPCRSVSHTLLSDNQSSNDKLSMIAKFCYVQKSEELDNDETNNQTTIDMKIALQSIHCIPKFVNTTINCDQYQH